MLNYHAIYDSEKGAIVLFYTLRAKTAVFQFSPATNPVKPTQIKKGMKIYDYQNSYYFSLTLPESLALVKMLSTNCTKEVAIGSIKCKTSENDTKVITVTHFPQKKDERTKDNMIITELSIVTGANKLTGATVTYKKIVNKKPEVVIPVRVSLMDFLALKSFLEKHQDFVMIAHALYLKSLMDKVEEIRKKNSNAPTPTKTSVKKRVETLEEYTIEPPEDFFHDFEEPKEFEDYSTEDYSTTEEGDFF